MMEEVLDVPALLRRALTEARALSQNQHRFEVQLAAGLGLLGGEAEFVSIATNLLSNAVRYTPPGGVIRIAWAAHPQGPVFSIADSGIGIAEKDIARLTERFYRVDVGRSRASGGTGLGLSIVKHALERYGGHLEVVSEIGVGSTFTCHFPAARSQAVATAEA
jgi:two-component system phosphate regulon sensor histidine kinase PhoR